MREFKLHFKVHDNGEIDMTFENGHEFNPMEVLGLLEFAKRMVDNGRVIRDQG